MIPHALFLDPVKKLRKMNNASRRVSYANDEEMQQHSLLTAAADAATTTFLPRGLPGRNSKRNKLGTMVNQSSRNVHERAKKSGVEIPPLPTTLVFSSSEISAIVRAMHQNFLFGKPINSGSLLHGQKG